MNSNPPQSPPPSTRKFQQRREELLSVAAATFNRSGIKGATLAEIASSVNLATNSVTYYYRKKEDLAKSCFTRSIEKHQQIIDLSLSCSSFAEGLRLYFRLHAQLLASIEAGEHSPLILFNDMRALPDGHQTEVFDAYTSMFRQLRRLFELPGIRALSRIDLNARTHLIISLVNWLVVWFFRYEKDEYIKISERIVDILLFGICKSNFDFPNHQSLSNSNPSVTNESKSNSNAISNESFLCAATLLVNEQGYPGASIDKIAAHLNVTKGAFYHYNQNKFDLISECFDRSFDAQRQILVTAEKAHGNGWHRISSAAVSLIDYQLGPRGPLLRASATSALPDQEHRIRVHQTMLQLTERMAGLIVDGMIDGSLRVIDPVAGAHIICAMVNGATEINRWIPGCTNENAADLYIRPCLLGLLIDSPFATRTDDN